MDHLFEAMDNAAESESFRARMSTVDHLEIEGCSIDRAAAEQLCRLFPCLCKLSASDERPRSLKLEHCVFREDASCVLFCMHLECLAIVECTLPALPLDTPSLASLLSSISSMGDTLRTLILYYDYYDDEESNESESKANSELGEYSEGTLLQAVQELRYLTSLYLGRTASIAAACDPEAVRGLLSKLPLQFLQLSCLGACPVLPPSVEVLCLDIELSINPFFPHASNLHGVIDMLKDLRHQTYVTACELWFNHMGSINDQLPSIKSLCHMPFKTKCTGSFSLVSHELWDIPEFVRVLDALKPIKQSFASVEALKADNVCIEPSALRALASLFESCESLALGFEAKPMNPEAGYKYRKYVRGGLQELVHGMPRLSYLKCPWEVELKDDYIQALRTACDLGRAFKLVLPALCIRRWLEEDRFQEETSFQQQFLQEWQHIRAALPLRQRQKVQLELC